MGKLKLYTELAEIYDNLYQSVFDYETEAELVETTAMKYEITNILELGCGTGRLTELLIKKGLHVEGVDLYDEMLNIAREKLPDIKFYKQDIRNLKFDRLFDFAVLLSRTIAYMITDEDLNSCINSIYNCLNPGGLVLFDSFNAKYFIKNLKEDEKFVQESESNGVKIRRTNSREWNLENGVTFDWTAKYEIFGDGEKKEIIDKSVIRTFFTEEIKFKLESSGFECLDITDNESLFIVLAQKEGY